MRRILSRLITDLKRSDSRGEARGGPMVTQIAARQLKSLLDTPGVQLVDVREPHEHSLCRIDGAVLLPMSRLLRGEIAQLDPTRTTVCYCHHGSRSQRCAEYLLTRGFRDVRNLSGGIDSWSVEIDPSVRRY